MPPKRKSRIPPKRKFDPDHKPVKPEYPQAAKVWRSAEGYSQWQDQCAALRSKWEEDVEEWKALYKSGSDWEDWNSEEDCSENEATYGLDDPRWGPHTTYAVLDDHGIGPDDPRMPNEQLARVLPAVLNVLASYSNAQIQPTISNICDAKHSEADERSGDLLPLPRLVSVPADVPEAAESPTRGPCGGVRAVKCTEKPQKKYRPSLSVSRATVGQT